MTCRELTDFLNDYLDGALPESQRQAFDRHLAVCPTCVAYLDTYRQTIALAAASGDQPAHKPIPEPLVKAILDSLSPG